MAPPRNGQKLRRSALKVSPHRIAMTDLDRRRFLNAAAATVAGSALDLAAIHRRSFAMTGPVPDGDRDPAARGPHTRPLGRNVPDADRAGLTRRRQATRWRHPDT